MELQEGDVFAGHRILGVAGRGGMGVVYRAQQLDLDRVVALKLIASGLAADPAFRERFVRESRAAAAIDHPNVIPVYYAGEHEGRLYIAMRFVEGEDLRALINRVGGLEPAEAVQIVAQIGAALDAAHERGLVHRDVKPANVLLGQDRHAYLTDFGLTKRTTAETTVTGSGHWVGTLGYISPEQIRGEPIDARADVYALGCVLYYAVTGSSPYRRESDEATLLAHLQEPPPSMLEAAPAAPEALQDVVDRALSKDPDDRFPSAGDLVRAALAAVGDAPAPPPERLVARGAAAPGGAAEADTAVPVSQTPTRVAPPARPALRRFVAPALALLAGAATVLVTAALLDDDGDPGGGTTGTTASAAGRVAATVDVGSRPNDVVVAGGRAWVTSPSSPALIGIDVRSGARRELRLPWSAGTTSVAAGFGSLWVLNARADELARIDPASGRVRGRVPLGRGDPVTVAAGEGAVWVGRRQADGGGADSILKIDPIRLRVVGTQIFGEEGVQEIAVGRGAVWITNRRRDRLSRLDVRSGGRSSRPVGFRPRGVAVGPGAIWVANSGAATVSQVDFDGRQRASVRVGSQPTGVAVAEGAVWVTNFLDNTVTRIDPATRRTVGAPLDVGTNPFAIAAAGADVWVTNVADDTLTRIADD